MSAFAGLHPVFPAQRAWRVGGQAALLTVYLFYLFEPGLSAPMVGLLFALGIAYGGFFVRACADLARVNDFLWAYVPPTPGFGQRMVLEALALTLADK